MVESDVPSGSQLPLALRLRERRDWSSFIARGNEALVTQLRDLADRVAAENQLFLRGEPGSGRTHLLEATVQRVLDHGDRACMLPARELCDLPPSVLEGLEEQNLLALDDLETLAGQPAWEEGLFHLYNRCRARGCAWVVAAAEAPRYLGLRLPDLASRLAAGGVYRVQPLDEPGLLCLLQQRARARGLALAPDVAEYIMRRHARSPAALCETLDQLDREALARKRRLTVPLVREVLGW